MSLCQPELWTMPLLVMQFTLHFIELCFDIGWRFGVVVVTFAHLRCYSVPGPVSIGWAGEPSRYVTATWVNSAFYPLWDGKMSISFGAE